MAIEFFDEEEKQEYQGKFVKAFDDWADKQDADHAAEVLDELQQYHNVRHSGDGYVDSELNILRAENALRSKHRFDSATESYLRFKSQEDGKSLADVKRAARKILKGGNR